MSTKISQHAVRLLAEAAEANHPWFAEYSQWVGLNMGAPPDRSVGSRAREEWDCTALGALMVFEFFARELAKAAEETPDAVAG